MTFEGLGPDTGSDRINDAQREEPPITPPNIGDDIDSHDDESNTPDYIGTDIPEVAPEILEWVKRNASSTSPSSGVDDTPPGIGDDIGWD